MCGIAGILQADRGNAVDPAQIEDMRDALRHRGPDDAGIFVEGSCGLAHTRLSILDLSARARQPMRSASGRFVIAFNGEIYNYRELREGLRGKGRSFETTSDTEVILHLAEEGGLAALQALRGMFAIALLDRERHELHLIRDRLGIKPLFWARVAGGIAFASEPKALVPLVPVRSPDASRVAEYLGFRHVAGQECLTPGIETLGPGQRLRTDGREVEVSTWWSSSSGPPSDPLRTGEIVAGAVRRQLVSDVPVGTFLSGGIDSALVTAFAADALPGLDTFTVGFEDARWDETPRARSVARALGVKAHEFRMTPAAYLSGLGEATWYLDAPLNHAHSVHLLELARFARRHVTVVLTGEGSDELFAGYPRYRLFRLGRLLRLLPAAVTERAARELWARSPRVARLLEAAAPDWRAAAARNAAFVSLEEAARLAGLDRVERSTQARCEMLERAAARGCTTLDALLDMERRTYLISLLQRMDRMTMAAGLEARVPLLDEAVLDFSLALPASQKLGYRDTKRPMRAAAETRFGRAHARAPKSGFGVPLGEWMRRGGVLEPVLGRVLAEPRTRTRGWIDVDRARQHFEAHRSGAADRTELLWAILALELWGRVCVDGDDARTCLD